MISRKRRREKKESEKPWTWGNLWCGQRDAVSHLIHDIYFSHIIIDTKQTTCTNRPVGGQWMFRLLFCVQLLIFDEKWKINKKAKKYQNVKSILKQQKRSGRIGIWHDLSLLTDCAAAALIPSRANEAFAHMWNSTRLNLLPCMRFNFNIKQ